MLVVTFELGEQTYAVPADVVREVTPLPELHDLPKTPGYVRGLLTWRGELTPAIDLSELTTGTPCRDRLSTRLIVVTVGPAGRRRPLGLMAEGATETGQVAEEALEPSPVAQKETPHLGRVLRLTDGRLIQCIDVERVVAESLADCLFPADSPEAP